MKRVVSLFLPTWPTDRLSRRLGNAAPKPETPVVLVGRQGNRRMVLAVNTAARALGLHPGMSATQAQALLPDLATFDAEPKEDTAALGRLAHWALRRYAPVVAADPPDGLAIDATGAVHLHGSEQLMLADMVGRLAKAGVAARAAMAGTYACAHALARHHPEPIVNMTAAEGRAAAARLPIAGLRLTGETVRALRVLGFHRIGEVLAQQRAPFVLRFGEAFGRRLDQLTGDKPEPITPVAMPDIVTVSRNFGEPISAPETLERHIGLLVERFCTALETRGLGARKLDLLFHRVDNHVEAIRIGTSRPARDPKRLTRLLLGRLETIDPGFGIERMMLSAPIADPLDYRAARSLGEEPQADVAALMDTLTARVGPERLYRVALVESDVPERSVARVAPLSEATVQRWPHAWPRPSRLLSSPEPIATVALLPDHPPATFTWRGVRHRVIRADGPERIHGEWIRSENETYAARDYFLVEDEAGLRFWVFRKSDGADPDTGQHAWFLHGLFA